MKRSAAHRLLAFWILLILYGSFFPFQVHVRPLPDHLLAAILNTWPRRVSRFEVRDFVVNVTLYLPLGALWWWAARGRSAWSRVVAPVAGGLLLSSVVELLQYFISTRTATLFDVVCDTVGSGLGILVAWLADARLPQLGHKAAVSKILRPSANLLLLGAWVGYQIAPFFPALSRTKVAAKFAVLASTASMSWVAAAVAWSEWLAVAWVLSDAEVWPESWLLGLLLLMPARVLLEGRLVTMADIVGGVLAALTWLVVRRLPARARIVGGILVAGILVDGLRPFHFAGPPSTFQWVPFSGALMSLREFGLSQLLRKTFVYGAAILLLTEWGIALSISAVSIAVVLGAIEVLQRYLPGRTAEITDPLLALGVGYALWLVRRVPVTSMKGQEDPAETR